MARTRGRGVVAGASALALLGCSLLAAVSPTYAGTAAREVGGPAVYLVTLEGPGTAGRPGPPAASATAMISAQDDVLASVDAGEPLYRWTTALNGFAVELDPLQADRLDDDPEVALVERDRVLPLASTSAHRALAVPRTSPHRPGSGGAGTVIGLVDTGIAPDNPAFRVAAGLGPSPRGFQGSCADAPDDPGWDADSCNAKVVAGQYFVAGYGTDALRSAAVLSPYDTDGHGTEMASIAAGAPDVRVRAHGHRLGRFSGVAPRARIAAYKACWSAPDPDDDGCAAADVVAAIDRATADGVDVLNLSIGGRAEIDTVERALLGAAEGGIVVTAAAGNTGDRAYAAHPSPWVVTVGASHAAERVGEVLAAGGPRLRGASSTVDRVGGRLVLGADLRARGAERAAARHCLPGSLDAGRTDGVVVVCARGEGPRVDKSRTVDLAGGAGMVLVNTRQGSVDADLHSVPTVHLAAPEGHRLLAWARRADRRGEPARVRLLPGGVEQGPDRVAAFSPSGDPTSTVLKPDVVAPGTEVVAATPAGWDLVSGTSAAAARVAGAAAVLLGRPGATAPGVRSALATTAAPVGGPGLRSGAGVAAVGEADPGLAFLVPPRSYRAWLVGERADLDLPQVLLADGRLRARRTITNTSDHTVVLTAHPSGFHDGVQVSPEWARLEAGDRFTFRISAAAAPTATDDGVVEWHEGSATVVRIPVVVTR
ncbi:S8 family serine peptidase [Nocardioides panacisoli]|uniref:Peptidase S8/S53 domain-containing protein n=1 Tax=Nocardioides panacisoli TaxID=627624 RepID=A0ABP7IEH1_9ACTN